MTYDVLSFTDKTGRKCYVRHLPTKTAHNYVHKLSRFFNATMSYADMCFIPKPDQIELTEKQLKDLVKTLC